MPKATRKSTKGFSDFERSAIQERAKELMLNKKDGEGALLAKIAEMEGTDKEMAEKFHKIMKEHAPELSSKTWYGMPAYRNKDDKVIVFFQAGKKFQARYATIGFSDTANLDEGEMWPTSFGLRKLGKAEETKIIALVKKAIN